MDGKGKTTAPYNRGMNDEAYKVTVAKDLEDLIPAFMRNRNKELETLKVALAAADFEQLRQLGHRSEEHTSELQSRLHLVCRLLLEKKKETPAIATRVATALSA